MSQWLAINSWLFFKKITLFQNTIYNLLSKAIRNKSLKNLNKIFYFSFNFFLGCYLRQSYSKVFQENKARRSMARPIHYILGVGKKIASLFCFKIHYQEYLLYINQIE